MLLTSSVIYSNHFVWPNDENNHQQFGFKKKNFKYSSIIENAHNKNEEKKHRKLRMRLDFIIIKTEPR